MKAGLERAWKLWTSDLQQTCIPKVVLEMDFRGCLLIISVLVNVGIFIYRVSVLSVLVRLPAKFSLFIVP